MKTDAPPITLNAQYLRSKFDAGLEWNDYLASDAEKAKPWREMYEQATLTPEQQALIAGFVRQISVLISTGIWCGDCAQQCPLIQKIADCSNGRIHVRYLDRDEHRDFAEQIQINAGLRVPTVIFMAEDFEPVSIMGDCTLSRYRAAAMKKLGPACVLPGASIPADEMAEMMQDWLDEIERVHLLLRLSGRLREKHGD